MTPNTVNAYRVEYYDEWLDITNFNTVYADTIQNAREVWKEEHKRDDKQSVLSIEPRFSFDLDRVKELTGIDLFPELG